MALATGDLELIRLMWARLPGEQLGRCDLMEVASDFHRDEPLLWLYRDASDLEREALAEFAMEFRLADTLLFTGVRPWSRICRELAALWPAARSLVMNRRPSKGASVETGWTVSAIGATPLVTRQRVLQRSAIEATPMRATIPPSAVSVGQDTFDGRAGLMRVSIPPSVRNFGARAFAGCSSLRSLTIPPLVTTIGERAFADCTGLVALTVPSSVTHIGAAAFGCCSALRELTVLPGEGALCILEYAFDGCVSLVKVTIPVRACEIGRGAFSSANLEELTVPGAMRWFGHDRYGNHYRSPVFVGAQPGTGGRLRRLELLGPRLDPAVFQDLAQLLTPDGLLIGAPDVVRRWHDAVKHRVFI
jgi:hypothetical protein